MYFKYTYFKFEPPIYPIKGGGASLIEVKKSIPKNINGKKTKIIKLI